MTATVIEAALRGAAFAAVVGLGLALLRVTNVPVRKAAWIFVLVASAAMPLLMYWPSFAGLPRGFGWMLPPNLTLGSRPAAVRAAPMTTVSVPVAQSDSSETTASSAWTVSMAPGPEPAVATRADAGRSRQTLVFPPLRQMVLWIYFFVAGILLLRLLIGAFAALRLWITAEEVSPLDVPEEGVRVSARLSSPVTVGSGIVLPADYAQWSHGKLRMVLAHERSHVRQMDFWLQLLAGLYTAAFWFSPLGWWLRRTLAALGEAISDRAGIRAAASGPAYAQVVLEFAEMPHRRMPGVAMACSGNLSKRMERMLNDGVFRAAFAEGRLRATLSLLLIPAALFVATALVRMPRAEAQSLPVRAGTPAEPEPNPTPTPSAAPQKTSAAVQQVSPTSGQTFPGQAESQVLTTQAAPEPAPVPPVEPPPAPASQVNPNPPARAASAAAPVPQPGHQIGTDGEVNATGFHFSGRGDSWAIVGGPGDYDFTSSGSRNGEIGREIAKARRMDHGTFLWFMHDGKSYVVDDPATVAQMQAIDRQMRDLVREQALLGQTQANLGNEQAALSEAQRETGTVQLPDMQKIMAQAEAAMKSAQSRWNAELSTEIEASLRVAQSELSPQSMAAIRAEVQSAEGQLTPEKMAAVETALKTAQAKLSPEKMAAFERLKAEEQRWNAQSIAEMQARLAQTQARLARIQADLQARNADRVARLSQRMARLGDEQGRLGAQQGVLGAKQGRLAEQLDRQIPEIIRQSLQNGTARPVQ